MVDKFASASMSLIPVVNLPPGCRWYRWCTLTCEYLRQFSKQFETVFMEYSGAGGKLIHEKKTRSKTSRDTVPLTPIIVVSILERTYSMPGIYFFHPFTCLQKLCLWRTRCVCYVTLSLTPRGLNLCHIVMWNYIVNMIMYMYKTGCSAWLEKDIAIGCFQRFYCELCTACCQFVQNKIYVSYVLCINSRKIFPRS